jgi:acyl-CoA thioesterase I
MNVYAASKTILIVGDSLSTAYGMSVDKGWVSLWQKQLKKVNPDVQVINASITGQTTSQALQQLPGLLKKVRPNGLILQLSGNDMLQGKLPSQIYLHFSQMIDLARENNARVLVLAVRSLPNYGRAYQQAMRTMFARLAEEKQVLLEAQMLQGVGEHLSMMQADGLHPKASSQEAVLKHLLPSLKRLLDVI